VSVKHYTIPVFIPELACPFQCVFCNQQKITGKTGVPDDKKIVQTIESHLHSFKIKERVVELGFFGGSFTGIPMNEQARLLDLVQPFLENRQIHGIRVSTRPDYIDEEILALLKNKKVTTIELGAQSLDDEVLKASFRGHTPKQTEKAAGLILKHNFDLGLQMMIGLPGDTLEKSLFTANRIINLGASNTRIYPTVVIKGTALHKWYIDGKYIPISLDEAIEWTKQILPIFEASGVSILRVGLHPSEGLLSGDELVAGPFHPSFKELVMTEIWADLLRTLLQKEKFETLEIRVPEKELNFAIGYHGKNKKMLLNHFKEVKFIADSKVTKRSNYQAL
jgi:histone acetyltransferase (RNA polymerase elongator complex component)